MRAVQCRPRKNEVNSKRKFHGEDYPIVAEQETQNRLSYIFQQHYTAV